MFIKLSNANPQLRGQTLIVRKDIIRSIFRTEVTRENGDKDTVTYMWGGEEGVWEVEETPDEIWTQLK